MHLRRTQSCFIVTAEGLLDVTKTFASLQGFDKGEFMVQELLRLLVTPCCAEIRVHEYN
jgi:hypothetical protein